MKSRNTADKLSQGKHIYKHIKCLHVEKTDPEAADLKEKCTGKELLQICVNLSRNKRQSWLSIMTPPSPPPKETKANLNATSVSGIGGQESGGAGRGGNSFQSEWLLHFLHFFQLQLLLTPLSKAKMNEYTLVLGGKKHINTYKHITTL